MQLYFQGRGISKLTDITNQIEEEIHDYEDTTEHPVETDEPSNEKTNESYEAEIQDI